MFHVPKNAQFSRVSRRKFMELGGGVATALGAGSVAVGLNSTVFRSAVQAQSSDEAKWKQYDGSKLVFMSENTPPSFAIRDNLQAFYDLTGIEVEILTDDLPVVQQKVGIDLRGGNADFHLNYVQDKPIGSPFADFYADLTKFTGDDTLPQDPEGYGDDAWFENFLTACGVYYEPGRIVAFPYDCAVACTFYRQDLFEELSKDFEAEYGYRMEFTDETTWQHVQDFATFFKSVREGGRDDIPYGYGQHQGSFAWTTQLDIQRMLFANGQWTEFDVDDKLGSKEPGPTKWGDEQSVLIMQKYKDQADVSHPDNLANGTLELNTVYQAGDIAMQVQYHEFAASIEDENTSRAAGGKTAYAPCPKGDPDWITGDGPQLRHRRHRHQCIRLRRSPARRLHFRAVGRVKRDAAWCAQRSRRHTHSEIGVRGARGCRGQKALTFDAVYDNGIRDPNFVLGPKIPEANEYHNIILTEVQRCVSGETSADEACEEIRWQVDDLHDL